MINTTTCTTYDNGDEVYIIWDRVLWAQYYAATDHTLVALENGDKVTFDGNVLPDEKGG